jgi:hydrogenase maturation factor/beta-phosphoglucomutase-like phosphatase (HAD superfamily)
MIPTKKTMHIKAVLFHLESTLVLPGRDAITRIKTAIGCPAETSPLDYIRELNDSGAADKICSSLQDLEIEAVASSKPSPGAADVLRFLRKKNLRLALVTGGSRPFADKLLQKLSAVSTSDFEVLIDRAAILAHPPGANTVQLAAAEMNIDPSRLLVVASSASILRDGLEAGAAAVLFSGRTGSDAIPAESAYQISRWEELKPIVRMGIPLPAGKLPNDLLREFLNGFEFNDPSILINPGVGEDTAAVDIAAEEVLVLKSDPITFATDCIGQYAVLINANDIATSGAQPRWLLTTLLFPSGVTPSEIRRVINELKESCRRWNITLCGGHTEITDAVTRPVVTGMMAGTVARKNLIDKRNVAVGDRVLLTKAVAVEGTAIIAREFGVRLEKLGLTDAEVERCRQFLNHISILPEAKIAAESTATSAMHDVTEGGLATALEELSIAAEHRFRINMETIPIFAETRRIGRLLNIKPLGLIGSGSLLICCRPAGCSSLMDSLRRGGIAVTCIGEVLERGRGVTALKNGRLTVWPQFEVDEITRLF